MKNTFCIFLFLLLANCGSSKQGEPGPAGTSFEIVKIISCNKSTNLTSDQGVIKTVDDMKINVFSNGSYFGTCQTTYANSNFNDTDTSFSSVFYPPTSEAVKLGILVFVPKYAICVYNISKNTAGYGLSADAEHQNATCSIVFP